MEPPQRQIAVSLNSKTIERSVEMRTFGGLSQGVNGEMGIFGGPSQSKSKQ